MSVPVYSEYKDSGVQWLGKIPDSWCAIPFGALLRRIKRVGHADEELLSVYRDYGVIRKADRDDNFNSASEDLSTYQLVEPGDLAMNKMKAFQGSLGISDYRGIVSPAYFVFTPRRQFHPQFLHYLLRSPPYAAGYMTISKGIRINQWDVDPDHLSALPVLFPTLKEQVAIATFLDRETAKIDALVVEQERLIALLKEKRQAVISNAVTKGLNPNAPMKDSGIEWLGGIPAHWEVRRLKHVSEGVTVGIVVEPSKWYVEDGIPALRSLNVRPGRIEEQNLVYISEEGNEIHKKSRLNKGDVVVVRTGQPGTAAVVPEHLDGCNCIDLIVIRSKESICEQYLCRYLAADVALRQFTEGSGGAIQQHFNIGTAVDLLITVPPLSEQKAIAEALEQKAYSFDLLIQVAEAAITLLQERRAALISAAVTGKIDVRGLVPANEALEVA